MAFGAMPGQDSRPHHSIDLTSFGYIGPDQGDQSDMVVSDMFSGASNIPSWIELVDVKFLRSASYAASPSIGSRSKESEVYDLINFAGVT